MFSGLENPTHWLILLAIALVVLGPKRLPDAGRALGQGLRGFKESLSGEQADAAETAAPPASEPAVVQVAADATSEPADPPPAPPAV